MLNRRGPEIYLKQRDEEERFQPHHVVVLFVFLTVLYVAGSALVSLLSGR